LPYVPVGILPFRAQDPGPDLPLDRSKLSRTYRFTLATEP